MHNWESPLIVKMGNCSGTIVRSGDKGRLGGVGLEMSLNYPRGRSKLATERRSLEERSGLKMET